MKVLLKFLIVFILMTSLLFFNNTFADEENPEESQETTQPEAPAPAEQPTTEQPAAEEQATQEMPQIILEKAKVLEASEPNLDEANASQDVKLKITTGEHKGEEYTAKYELSYDINGKVKAEKLSKGNAILVQITTTPEGTISPVISGVNRTGSIVILFIIFCISLVLIAGNRGLKFIISLFITAVAIWFILVKLIVAGWNSVFVAFLTSSIIVILTSVLFSGIHRKAFASGLGAIGGVLVACIFTAIFSNIAKLSGVREEAIELSNSLVNMTFKLKDIILASGILASTGICLDISMHITNLLYSEKSKTEDMELIDVFKNGMKKGKDVIGSKAIILFLVYCASSLSLIILFLACNMHIIEIVNKDIITEQIIASFCGSLGVLYTIPACSIAFAFFNRKKVIYPTKPKNRVEGKRSIKIK